MHVNLFQIWECEAVHDPLDMVVGNALAQVVELIITQYEWFFQNDASLPWDHLLPSTPLGLHQSSTMPDASPIPTTRERKMKGKKAPPPPSSTLISSPPPSPLIRGDGVKHKTSSQPPGHAPPSPPLSFPVPAPRNIKPALPTKPEGLALHERTRENTHL